jgi:hypothetical protein
MKMADPDLSRLESEVEAARAKLHNDLAALRSPTTVAKFTAALKEEALEAKDAVLEQAKSVVTSSAAALVEDLKARAAANPAAALAIGAGIAWRLVRHPPIATVLIGAGLLSLFRTVPAHVNGRTNADYLARARDNLVDQAIDAGQRVMDRAVEATETVSQKMTATAAQVGQTAQRLTSEAAAAAGDAVEKVHEMGTEYAERAINDVEARDQLLLGAAGLAVVAAVGIAFQRRVGEDG